LLDPAEWGVRYFAVDGDDQQLVGFFVFKAVSEDVEIGLGLRPDLTGGGLGGAFIEAGLRFAEHTFAPRSFSLAVATFNQRAITVYQRAGFRVVESYDHETNGGVHPFARMTRGPILPN
jgi:[ribosomal protein S18]-alanine N-acetyltransferase